MKGREIVLLFVTTEAALRAEDVLLGLDFVVDVVPRPPGLSGLCGLALAVDAAVLAEVEDVLRLEGVPFTIYRSGARQGDVAPDVRHVYTPESASSGGDSCVSPPDNRILTPAPAVRPGPHESEGGEPN